jgi:acyl transferase domain-containing protein
MEERLGFVVSSIGQLEEKLAAYLNGGKNIEDTYHGRVEPGNAEITTMIRDDDMQEAIDRWIVRRKFSKLLDLWTRGLNLDWNKLYGNTKPRRISLPTYPFARERYWVDEMTPSHAPNTPLEVNANMKSIEEIINQIDNNTMEAEQAVEVLKLLV